MLCHQPDVRKYQRIYSKIPTTLFNCAIPVTYIFGLALFSVVTLSQKWYKKKISSTMYPRQITPTLQNRFTSHFGPNRWKKNCCCSTPSVKLAFPFDQVWGTRVCVIYRSPFWHGTALLVFFPSPNTPLFEYWMLWIPWGGLLWQYCHPVWNAMATECGTAV